MSTVKWLAALPVLVAALAGSTSAVAVDEVSTPTNAGPISALSVTGLPFQASTSLSGDDPVQATDPANSAVAQACNGGAPLYMPRWFRYDAAEDVDVLVRSSAVPGDPSSSTPVVSPIAWVAGDGSTVLGCGITHAFDRQQIGPAFLAAGDSAFVVQFVPTMAEAVTFARDGYTLHTRIQAAPGSLEGGPSNDSWWTPTRLPSDRPHTVSADVGLATLGSVEVDLAEDTACWGGSSPGPILQPAVWYSYAASADEPVTLDTSGSDYPIAVVVATESTNGPSHPVCLGSGAARHSFSADTGTEYLIGLYGYDLNNVNVASHVSLSVLHRPDPPVSVSAVAGQAQAEVSWMPGGSDGGSAVTGFTATAYPGGQTCSTTGATSCTVNGLTSGTAYTITVTAANDIGTSAASIPSSVTPEAPARTEVGGSLAPEPLRFTGPPARPSPSVWVRSAGHRSRLSVDVNPNRSKGYWTFLVQRKSDDGTWKRMRTYRTNGRNETRTINLRKGTYRVWVNPRYGHQGVLSDEVHVRK